MNLSDVRTKYLTFFEARGHAIVPSASLIPLNDPTTLFTGSGMQPMVPYLLGEEHPSGTRVADSQRSFRAEDIDEVGDNRHTTFFEMLGNWSFGDYFKEEQIAWMFEFLVDEIGIDPERLYVTAFIGDEAYDLPRDTESVALWKKLFASKGIEATDVIIGSEADGYEKGMQGGRIFYYDARKNWWSRAGTPDKMPAGEPGGPDTEMFYDFGTVHDEVFGPHCHPNCDCGRFMEIGNNVFMQYLKKADGTFGLLPKRNVDFGGGLERIAAAANQTPDVFKIDIFESIISLLEAFSGKSYEDLAYQRSFRIVADHMRATVFMLADGVRPSNTERGYVLRRLIRRAAQHAQKIGVQNDQKEGSMLNRCAVIIIEKYKAAYPELASDDAYQQITSEIWKEEVQFGRALDNGMKEFEKMAQAGTISGADAFTLFTTYGFPFEMTLEIARERTLSVDAADFEKRMKEHQELSRSGSEQKFKGGLADHSEATVRLHTTHHILLKALQMVLGDHVKQRGSNITGERLRIDFSHGEKMTDDQKKEVERIVNDAIKQHLPMTRSTMPKEEAEGLGAQHEFGAKYPDVVSVYSLGPVGATLENPQFDQAFSIEFCGGPHVTNTSEIESAGTFRIQKEEAVASGIRRIKGVLV
ncbi:alanine--tRNA ligase [Candidatus Kaiserbacteria bacterium]|nr:alanine--tRNA ligase [Candidatus Kaiserbacteria bacterium]